MCAYFTLVEIYDDKKPFDKKQEIILDFKSYYAAVSLDRRSSEEQESNRFVIVALVASDGRTHEFVKIPFPGTTCNEEDIVFSEVVEDEFIMCHTMRDNIVVAFYPYHAQLYDGDLI